MAYVILVLVGFVGGGACMFVALDTKRRSVQQREEQQEARGEALRSMAQSIETRQQELDQQIARFKAEQAEERRGLDLTREAKLRELDQQAARLKAEQAEELRRINEISEARHLELYQQAAHLKTQQIEFEKRLVSYSELREENAILKRDLRNIDVNLHKSKLDHEVQRQAQEALDQRSRDLGSRYLKENVKWIGSSLTQNNFVNSKQRLQETIERCRDIGCAVSDEEEAALLANLREEYEKMVRAAFEREEQARIRAQIREEQKLKAEIDRELKQLERERTAIQAALDKALAEAKDEHSAQVEQLKARLAEAEAKAERATSLAEMTKAGHVYVISNIGSFGEHVFKIGMTRRLEPEERVKELGDASVPFPFDVHMMISSDDAPTLENALHRKLHSLRLNKINLRKEFFKTDIEAIRQIVEEHHGQIQYVVDPEALEYRQSLVVSDEDEEFIESVYDKLTDDGDPAEDK